MDSAYVGKFILLELLRRDADDLFWLLLRWVMGLNISLFGSILP